MFIATVIVSGLAFASASTSWIDLKRLSSRPPRPTWVRPTWPISSKALWS